MLLVTTLNLILFETKNTKSSFYGALYKTSNKNGLEMNNTPANGQLFINQCPIGVL